MKKLSNQTGVGMIEVLVTVIILAIGLLGVASLQGLAIKTSGDASQRSVATMVLADLIDRMHMNNKQIEVYKTAVNANGTTCKAAPDKQCSAARKGGAALTVNACSAAEIAAFDAWDVMCGHANGTAKSSMSNYLLGAKVVMTCVSTPCENDEMVTINLSWASRANDANRQKIIYQGLM